MLIIFILLILLDTSYGSHVTMYEPSSQKNYNIEPSISTSYEIGTEFRLFNNRLWGDFNYYTRDDKDQIISVTSAPQSGYSTRKMNAGLIRNRGVELSLGGMPVSTKNWKWEMNFNIAKNSNKLVELADGWILTLFIGLHSQLVCIIMLWLVNHLV